MKQQRQRIVDVHAEEKTAIRCEKTGRLQARSDMTGLYLFCRQCNEQHLLTWEELLHLNTSLAVSSGIHVVYI